MASAGYDSSDDSSAVSSDDEFLTSTKPAGKQDREALIRKKLLESFYGAEAVASNNDEEQEEEDEDEEEEEDSEDEDIAEGTPKPPPDSNSDDLDSHNFDAVAHTNQHVHGSSLQALLERDENLALEVRTLDSTMQTLVYENYSKFIDATDAIRNIGRSVHTNEAGLARLETGMSRIDKQSREVDGALGSLRDAVAEKLRVRRLLRRLDALLKLPTTLRTQIASGHYRSATQAYFSATQILGQHSAGFESLRSIETECDAILIDMSKDLRQNIVHWSGEAQRPSPLILETADFENAHTDWGLPPPPPKTIGEIFESASTLLLLSYRGESKYSTFSAKEVKSLALASCGRLLEHLLDDHHNELHKIHEETKDEEEDQEAAGRKLIANTFLDGILEATTLYGVSFDIETGSMGDEDRQLLAEFVSDSFMSFLSHTRIVLFEQTIASEEEINPEDSTEAEVEIEADNETSGISSALTFLLLSVRELASGLALPEIGLDLEAASSLVDQTVEVTESLVRRRVAHKFQSLHLRVLKECIGPFARNAAIQPQDDSIETTRIQHIVKMSSVALSDSLQLLDDTVRSILSGGTILGSSASSVDRAMVKQAVQKNARKFGLWLASTLEMVAGCDASDKKLMLDVEDDEDIEENIDDILDTKSATSAVDDLQQDQDVGSDDQLDLPSQEEASKVEEALHDLLNELDQDASLMAYADLTLSVSEMCRQAAQSVPDSIDSSIAGTSGIGKKASGGIFQAASTSKSVKKSSFDPDDVVSGRFHIAAARILGTYAVNRGADAASIGCGDFFGMACKGDEIPTAPRPAVWQLLEVAKLTSIDCADVFGGPRMAGPMPSFLDDENDRSHTQLGHSSGGGISTLGAHMSAIKGLQLDVERMFTEKVTIFSSLSQLKELTPNAVVVVTLKMAFGAMVEYARYSTFTTAGYRQLQVDVEFLRKIVPHYVKEETLPDGSNGCTSLYTLLNDVMMNAGDRCIDLDCVGIVEYYDEKTEQLRTPASIVRDFMFSEDADEIVARFVIEEE